MKHNFHTQPFNLKQKLNAVKVLFPLHEVTVFAMGPFDDIIGETVFGHCKVITIRRTHFTFEADGYHFDARIDSVSSFTIHVEE